MPPRSQDFLRPEEPAAIHRKQPRPKPVATDAHQSSVSNYTYSRANNHHRFIFFRIGPLRFGFHGLMGILSIILTLTALFLSKKNNSILLANQHPLLTLSIVLSTLSVAVGSYGMMNQVPISSHITSFKILNMSVVPPHRDAFQRTIAIVGYLNLRLCQTWNWWGFFGQDHGPACSSSVFKSTSDISMGGLLLHIVEWGSCCQPLLFAFVLAGYTNYHFFPLQADYWNGNTFVFVLPMWIGFSVDAFHQFPTWSYDKFVVLDWDRVRHWNESRVNETYLLWTLVNALQIAFMFTVAFRGKLSIQTCYWVAAVQVGCLFTGLFR